MSLKTRLLMVTSILAFGAVNFTSAENISDTNEVWISSTDSGGWIPPLGYVHYIGLGSVSNPHSVSNIYYGNYDAIICSLPTNTTIHLLPGVFYSKGYIPDGGTNVPYLKAHQRLIGAGRDISIIRRTNSANDRLTMVSGQGDGIEMSDFTVDAGANETDSLKNGLGIWGYSGGCMRRIKVINTCGNGWEGFPINNGVSGGSGIVIEECEVSSVRGTRVSAITLSGQGIVRNCRVYFPITTNYQQGTYQGYMSHWTSSAIFDGNFCDGGTAGFYTDTGGDTNLSIINNTFTRGLEGIHLGKSDVPGWVVDGVAIRNNTVQISTNIANAGALPCIAFGINSQNPNRNISISGNTLQYYGNGARSGQDATFAVQCIDVYTNLFNVRIVDNTIDRDFNFTLQGRGNWLAGNIDQLGNPLDFRLLSGSTPTTVYLGEPDSSIMVASSSTTVNIVFPHSWGFSNKEMVIMNKKTSSSVQAYPLSGESISGTATVSPGQTAKFLSDGNGIWTRETF